MTLDLKPLPFDEAEKYWKGKVVLPAKEFAALEVEARAKAFTVSGVAKLDHLQDIHDAIGQAIEEGTTLQDFKKDIRKTIQRKGWTGDRSWRIENIFRTNVQTSYQVGRYKQMTAVKKNRPFWKYDAINDSQTRPTHLAMDGKVFPADSPVWDTWYPPNGYQCRCGVVSLSSSDVQRRGLTVESKDPTGKLFEPVDPVSGAKLQGRLLMPDTGWDHNPAKQVWSPDFGKYEEMLGKARAEAVRKSLVERAKMQALIAREERKIVRSSNERAVVFDEDGKRLFQKEGQPSSVQFTQDELKKIADQTLTHNHPGGKSFSSDDVRIAATYKLREMRAVTNEYLHSLRPPEDGWSYEFWSSTIKPSYVMHDQDVFQEFSRAINQGTMTVTQAEQAHFHEVWTRVARNTGIKYSRQRRGAQ